MKITVLSTLIQLYSIQKSVSQVIRYCYYVDGGTCTSDIPVNSPDTVLRPETSAKINLTCMSPKPVKWDLNIPVDKQIDHQRAELLHVNGSENESYYYLEMNIGLKGLNGMISCRNYDQTASASVFIDSEKNLNFVGQQSAINFYVIEPKDEFIVPCVAAGFENLEVNLLETSKENIVRSGVSELCIRCLCNQDCDAEYKNTECGNCGPFFIGRQYWSDAGRMRPNKAMENDDWRACANDYECSVNTVRGYMRRHGKDCNGDGVITCEDIVSIHHGGPPCLRTNAEAKSIIKDNQECISKIKSDTDITDMATFDPKVGFTVDGSVDFNQYYVCTDATRKQQVTYAPLISNNRIPAKIYYELDPRSVSYKTISCETTWNVTLDLVFVDCLSLAHCASKMRPGLGVSMFTGAINIKLEFKNLGLASYTPSSPEGMIGCVQVIESQSASPRYVREVEHFFTGLDSVIYITTNKFTPKSDSIKTTNSIATSNSIVTDNSNATGGSIPINALVQLTHVPSNEFTHGSQHSFRCQISTFMLLPNIQFSVTLDDGRKIDLRNGSNISHVLTPKVEIRRTMLASTSVEQYLHIRVESNMKEISCSAPLINSKEHLTQTFALDIEADWSSWKIGLVATAFVMLALVSVGAIFFLFLKYRDVKKRLRQLTDEEINAFHNGDCDSNATSDPESIINVEKIGFPDKFKLSPNAFRVFQNELLGEGEYGRCVKGEMEGQDVAVKMTKSQTDVEYFKAFLKEVKVMAYIDSHENIVEFMGAMVDRISERVCYVVLELSPYGDLLGYLRKNVDKFELNQGSTTHDNKTSADIDIIRCVDLTNFCAQIASGMDHLSRKKMIHGDLAARNVLVFPNSRVKITDFGLSRKLYGSANYTKKNATPLPWRWMALESLKYLNFSTASDMWSFGVTMWEIFTFGLVPYPELTWSNDFIDNLHNGLRLQKPAHASVEMYDLMTRCWSQLPKDRPTFEETKYLLRSIAQREYSQYYLIVKQEQDDGDRANAKGE